MRIRRKKRLGNFSVFVVVLLILFSDLNFLALQPCVSVILSANNAQKPADSGVDGGDQEGERRNRSSSAASSSSTSSSSTTSSREDSETGLKSPPFLNEKVRKARSVAQTRPVAETRSVVDSSTGRLWQKVPPGNEGRFSLVRNDRGEDADSDDALKAEITAQNEYFWGFQWKRFFVGKLLLLKSKTPSYF